MAMSLSLAVTAGAAFNDQDKIVNTEAVDMCVALNIINGRTNGDFDPAGNVTRAEAAKMICIALNGGKEPVLSASATPVFADIAGHWAAKYIEYCVSEGIVAGKSATSFDPNGNVTGVELAKMLLIALGYNAEHGKFLGANWDTNVNVVASQKDLYAGLETIDPAVALSRDNAAQMIWNALQAKEVYYDYTLVTENGQLVSKVTVRDSYEYDDLMAHKYGTYDDEGIMVDFTYDEDKAEWTYYIDCDCAFENEPVAYARNFYGCAYTTTEDYTDLFQQNVKVIAKEVKGEVVVYGIFAEDSSVVAEGVMGDIDAADLADNSIEIDDVDYDTTATTVDSYAFGETSSSSITASSTVAATDKAFAMKAIDNTGDGKIDVIVYVPFSVEEVTYVGATTISTKTTGNVEIEEINLADGIVKGDYVMIVDGDNTVDGVAAYTELEVLSGKVASVKGSDVKVGDTFYTLANSQSMSLGTEYDFVVVAGYVYVAVATTSEVDLSDYAVVTNAQNGASWDADNSLSVLLFADGTSKTVAVEDEDQATKDALVTFEIDEDVYDLTAATVETNEEAEGYCGFDYAAKDTTYNTTTDKFAIGEAAFPVAADAVIFLQILNDDDSVKEYKVVTGADLEEMDSVKAALYAYATKDDATGFTAVAMAFVSTYSTDSSDDAVYGYVVEEIANVEDADGKSVYEITLADGTVLTTKFGSAANTAVASVTKGAVISYELTDGLVSALEIIGDTEGDDKTGAVAITAYNGKLVQFEDGKTYEITDETVIIYVNGKTTAVAEGGSIQLAHDNSDTDIPDYVKNAIFDCNATAENDDGNWELDLLVVDVNNNIYDAEIN